jgi:serine/threonine protein kinase
VLLIMSQLSHPNIVQYLGYSYLGGGEDLCLVLEYLPQGSVESYVKSRAVALAQRLHW